MENKKARIYTCTGDNGTTSLVGGKRVPKNHIRVETYGTLDELNAHLGLLAAAIDDEETAGFIEAIESNIMSIGGSLATESETSSPLTAEQITTLEQEIDRLEAALPPIHTFIMPGGNEAAARANLCRTVCRRAERMIAALQQVAEIPDCINVYINRLSDYLFLLQRQLLGNSEKKWEKPCR